MVIKTIPVWKSEIQKVNTSINTVYCATTAYHVELNTDLWRSQTRPTSKKNRDLVLAGASQEGEPRSDIPLNPPSFSLAADIYT